MDTPIEKPSRERLEAYLSQVLLRLFSTAPVLSSYIESSAVKDDGSVEISFFNIPHEVRSAVTASFGVGDVKTCEYIKRDHACVGFSAVPTMDDLSALAVDDDQAIKQFADDSQEAESPGFEAGSTGVEASANALLVKPWARGYH